MLCQWYPSEGLYKNRTIEGMYLLSSVPVLDEYSVEMIPKPLVQGCRSLMIDLQSRLNLHYNILDPSRNEWNTWFEQNLPVDDECDASIYIMSHSYECPLLSYFKSSYHDPLWSPPLPETSFSIFPSHVVVAMPSVQWQYDHHGPPAPFMDIDASGTANESIVGKYFNYRASENIRLATLRGKRLKEIINHKVKQYGARYSTSGTIQNLCSIVFECDSNFFAAR